MTAQVIGLILAATLAMKAAPTATGAEASQAPAREALIWNPDWARRPTGADMEVYYPRAAISKGWSGAALLRCRLLETGLLDACVVIAEAPKDVGFGAAAIGLSTRFRGKPRTAAPLQGPILIPVGFNLAPVTSPLTDLSCFASAPDFAEALTTAGSNAGPARRFLARAVTNFRAWGSTEPEIVQWVDFITARRAAVPKDYQPGRAECRSVPR